MKNEFLKFLLDTLVLVVKVFVLVLLHLAVFFTVFGHFFSDEGFFIIAVLCAYAVNPPGRK